MNAPVDIHELFAEHLQAEPDPIAWNDLRSFDATADESECVEDMFGRCLAARAGQASPRAVLRRLGHTVPIAIAVITALYFGGQLLRVFL